MTPHRFVMPKVTEIRVSRGAPPAQPLVVPNQRDLVVASLLTCPYGRGGRSSAG